MYTGNIGNRIPDHSQGTEAPQTERRPVDSVDISGVRVSHSPDGEWPRVLRDLETGEVVISGPDHHGFI